MTWQDIGILLNLAVTCAGGMFFLMKIDARLVRVETLLEYFLPKPKRESAGGDK